MSIISALRISAKPSAAFVIVGLFWGAFAAYVPVIKARLGVDDGVFGLLLLGSAFGLVSAMWLAPRLDRRLGPKAMQFAAVGMAAAMFLPGSAATPILFALAMVAMGAASGLLDVTMNARVSELEARHSRPMMSANHGMFSVAYAFSAVMGGVGREAGLSPLAMFAILSVVILAIAVFLHTEVSPPHGEEATAHDYPLWPILLCGSVVLIAFMSEATVEAWSALHVERTLGGGAAQGALGPATLGITMAFGRFSGQLLVEKFSETRVVFWAAILSSIGAAIAAVAPSPNWAYIGFGTLGLGVSVIGPMGLALVGKMVPARLRTEAISRVAVLGFSGFFIAPVLMGGLSQAFGLRVAFGSVALLLVALLPLAMTLTRRRELTGARA